MNSKIAQRVDFRTAYCRAHGCPPERFTQDVFRQCLHVRVRPFATLLAWWKPKFFRDDFMLIDESALVTTRNELYSALTGYREDCRMRSGFLHNQLRFRVSGRRLLNLFEETMKGASAAEPGQA